MCQPAMAGRLDWVWSYDFVFDDTEGVKRLKWLVICDTFMRECVTLKVEHRMTGMNVVRVFDQVVRK